MFGFVLLIISFCFVFFSCKVSNIYDCHESCLRKQWAIGCRAMQGATSSTCVRRSTLMNCSCASVTTCDSCVQSLFFRFCLFFFFFCISCLQNYDKDVTNIIFLYFCGWIICFFFKKNYLQIFDEYQRTYADYFFGLYLLLASDQSQPNAASIHASWEVFIYLKNHLRLVEMNFTSDCSRWKYLIYISM